MCSAPKNCSVSALMGAAPVKHILQRSKPSAKRTWPRRQSITSNHPLAYFAQHQLVGQPKAKRQLHRVAKRLALVRHGTARFGPRHLRHRPCHTRKHAAQQALSGHAPATFSRLWSGRQSRASSRRFSPTRAARQRTRSADTASACRPACLLERALTGIDAQMTAKATRR